MSATNGALTREALLQAEDLGPKLVEVPRVGKVWIRQLSETERVKQIELWKRPGGKLDRDREANANYRLMQLCVVDESGEPLLQYEELEDFKTQRGTGSVLSLLSAVLIENGLAGDEEHAEELLGKSED